jgi:hypothetical protein
VLVVSPLVFVTNIIAAIYKQNYLYATVFTALVITSIEFHTNPKRTLIAIFDRIAIYSVVFYGGYTFCRLNLDSMNTFSSYFWRGLILSTFLFCIWVYYWGYTEKQLCFHPDPDIGDRWHAILHLIGSIGHHMILFST